MNRISKYQIILILLVSYNSLLSNSISISSPSLPQDTIRRYTSIPAHLKPKESQTSVAVLFTQIPYDWIENAVEVPLFKVNNKLGLPYGLSLESSFQTIVVSNQIRSGPHWNYQSGKLSFGAGLEGEFMFGKMKVAGFNNKTWGWSVYPCIQAGYTIRDIAISLNGELEFIKSLKETSGNEEIVNSRNMFSGISLSLFIEQPLWKNHLVILGFVNNFQKVFFPAWPSFSTFDRRYYIPQFYFGLVL